MDNLLSGYLFAGYKVIRINIQILIWLRFRLMILLKWHWSQMKSLIRNGGGVDSLKWWNYNLIVAASSPAASIKWIVNVAYRIFGTSTKILKNYIESNWKEWAAVLTDNKSDILISESIRIINYPDLFRYPWASLIVRYDCQYTAETDKLLIVFSVHRLGNIASDGPVDLVLSCVDNFEARMTINAVCC